MTQIRSKETQNTLSEAELQQVFQQWQYHQWTETLVLQRKTELETKMAAGDIPVRQAQATAKAGASAEDEDPHASALDQAPGAHSHPGRTAAAMGDDEYGAYYDRA